MSEANSFQEGDIVVLKSGGPKMTIQEPGYWVKCIWFNELKSDFSVTNFMSSTLQLASSEVALPIIGGGVEV
ncbi:DUF2158 domain-containing protein [Chitinophaga sp. S165]|uniref:DUF2158 domain-containing protein n=1 Tax=Chitinophaga sp. S165 TaxID=2135462 RepID=UPI000D906371|nr:DUF2158 domain-containing protein [Chitinophaga sp. S165]PWV45361.1 uncharacterized protein DUF2158 [Chitinophaga sp. S165]